VGGDVTVLRRLRSGPFAVEDAIPLDAAPDEARAKLLPMATAVSGLPGVRVTADEARRLRYGQAVPAAGDGEVAVLGEAGELVAVGRVVGGLLQPDKVLPGNS